MNTPRPALRQQIDNLFKHNKIDIQEAKRFQQSKTRLDEFWKKRGIEADKAIQCSQTKGLPVMRMSEECIDTPSQSGVNAKYVAFSWEEKGEVVAYMQIILVTDVKDIPLSYETLCDAAEADRNEYSFFTDDTVHPCSPESIRWAISLLTTVYVDGKNDSPFINIDGRSLWLADIAYFGVSSFSVQ